jgi:hypothetical protein
MHESPFQCLDISAAHVAAKNDIQDNLGFGGLYHAECRDKNGDLKWIDDFGNKVTTEGLNFFLDTTLAGTAYTAALFMGLISSVSFGATAIGDTAGGINGANGWKEGSDALNLPTYTASGGQRPPVTFGTNASAGVKSATSTLPVFTIVLGGTAKGCFLATVSTKQATTGKLLSAGLFTGGDRSLQPSDTLTVSWQITAVNTGA